MTRRDVVGGGNPAPGRSAGTPAIVARRQFGPRTVKDATLARCGSDRLAFDRKSRPSARTASGRRGRPGTIHVRALIAPQGDALMRALAGGCDPAFGLRAAPLPPVNLGTLGYAWLASSTLRSPEAGVRYCIVVPTWQSDWMRRRGVEFVHTPQSSTVLPNSGRHRSQRPNDMYDQFRPRFSPGAAFASGSADTGQGTVPLPVYWLDAAGYSSKPCKPTITSDREPRATAAHDRISRRAARPLGQEERSRAFSCLASGANDFRRVCGRGHRE